jgi:ssDNA-binding Zn-finger/Zn-ribbon topoisomerase 1
MSMEGDINNLRKEKLIEELKNLPVNDIAFKKNQERLIRTLRALYQNDKESFSDEDIEQIKIINDIKELFEEVQYCKSKESIDQIIVDFHDLIGNAQDYEYLTKRIETYLKICLEKKDLLPSEILESDKKKKVQSFGPPPYCPKCKKLMILRESSRGYFWGCIDFPTCWGKRFTSFKKNIKEHVAEKQVNLATNEIKKDNAFKTDIQNTTFKTQNKDIKLLILFIENTKEITKLSDREYEIVIYHYNNGNKRTLEATGKYFSITRERVRQILDKIFKKIKSQIKYNLQFPKLQNQVVKKTAAINQKKSALDYVSNILNDLVTFNSFQKNQPERQNHNEIMLMDFFDILNCSSFTPMNKGFDHININKIISDLRINNHSNSKLINHGVPITQEEIDLIVKMHKDGSSLEQLETYFQRGHKSIKKILLNKGFVI